MCCHDTDRLGCLLGDGQRFLPTVPYCHDAFVQLVSEEEVVAERVGIGQGIWIFSEECVRGVEKAQIFLYGLVVGVDVVTIPPVVSVFEMEYGHTITVKASHVVREFFLKFHEIGFVYGVTIYCYPLVVEIDIHPSMVGVLNHQLIHEAWQKASEYYFAYGKGMEAAGYPYRPKKGHQKGAFGNAVAIPFG